MQFWTALDCVIRTVIGYIRDVSGVFTWPVVALIAGLTFFSSLRKLLIAVTRRVEAGSAFKFWSVSIDELKPSSLEEKKEKIIEEVREDFGGTALSNENLNFQNENVQRAIAAEKLALFKIENELNINITKNRKIGDYLFDGIYTSRNDFTIFEVKYVKDLRSIEKNKYKYSSAIIKASNVLIKNKFLGPNGIFSYVLVIVYDYYDGNIDEIKFRVLSDLNIGRYSANIEVKFYQYNELTNFG